MDMAASRGFGGAWLRSATLQGVGLSSVSGLRDRGGSAKGLFGWCFDQRRWGLDAWRWSGQLKASVKGGVEAAAVDWWCCGVDWMRQRDVELLREWTGTRQKGQTEVEMGCLR